ncbi:cytochrome P450 family protein [Nocardia macrotermitis]|uniref:Cytochrome P450 monooxygenase PikC n=1 Tax=Nocardia macrotermitis TaxID=2585198 RepID=A0A7K0D386_9NOCA|nr:cytochrome P450 [Nocardia macrotermitis]MQY20111.1 Cytochrome P450 monooxygenase PikC [Nocardia macrotermitis]
MTVGSCPFGASTHDVDVLHERMRTEGCGVHRAVLPDGSQAWVVTGYDAVTRLLTDTAVSAAKADSTTGFRGNRLPPALDANLLNLDGPAHRRLRTLAAEAFGPRHHRFHEQIVADTVRELVADLPSDGPIDLMNGLCEPLPARVTGTLLGLPPEQLGAFRDASAPLLRSDASHEQDALRRSMMTLWGLISAALADKRRTPGQDLLSVWIAARDGQDRLTEDELVSLAFLTIIGGFENTISSTAFVLDELVRSHQGHAREMLDRPSEFAALTRRLIREAAPMNYALRRFPLTDIEINGVVIPRGHTVFASLRSAHLDPAAHGRPDLVFGRGRHYCLGAKLAELQADHAARAVLEKYPHLRVAGPREEYRLRESWMTYSLAELTVSTGVGDADRGAVRWLDSRP